MKTTKTKTSEQISNEFLAPVIQDMATKAKSLGGRKGRAGGGKKWLAERLSELTGEHVRRERVEEWLHPDPDRRIQPRLGIGLEMKRVWSDEIKGRKNNKRKETKRDTNSQT
jgi:hypothetical protein